MSPRMRPRGQAKRHPLNMRTTEAIRRQLEQAAEVSGRSLAQEVEYRLEQSFNVARENELTSVLLGGDDNAKLLQLIASAVRFKPWQGEKAFQDKATRVLQGTIGFIIENFEALPPHKPQDSRGYGLINTALADFIHAEWQRVEADALVSPPQHDESKQEGETK
jgi:TraY domain